MTVALPDKQKQPLNVYVILAIGMASISFAAVLIRMAQGENVPSMLIAASRLILATLFLTPQVIRKHRQELLGLKKRDFALALVAGVFLALHFSAWVTSLEYTSVLISVVFVTSSPLWVALLEFLFLKTQLARPVIIGLLIAVSGGLLIGLAGQFTGETGDSVNQQRELLGGLLSLVGAIAVSVYFIIGRRFQHGRVLSIIPYLWLVYGSAAFIMTVVLIVTQTSILGYSNTAYLLILAMAIFPQLIGHSALNYATAYLPATIVSMTTQLEPIGSAILAYFIFEELPLPLQLVGSGIILAGVMLANLGQLNRPTNQSEIIS